MHFRSTIGLAISFTFFWSSTMNNKQTAAFSFKEIVSNKIDKVGGIRFQYNRTPPLVTTVITAQQMQPANAHAMCSGSNPVIARLYGPRRGLLFMQNLQGWAGYPAVPDYSAGYPVIRQGMPDNLAGYPHPAKRNRSVPILF